MIKHKYLFNITTYFVFIYFTNNYNYSGKYALLFIIFICNYCIILNYNYKINFNYVQV